MAYAIMRKTIVFTDTLCDSFQKDGKPQKIIIPGTGCIQGAVSKHNKGKLSGSKSCGRKRCTNTRFNSSFKSTMKQGPNRFF